MDYAKLAAELLKAFRGKRSQTAFSARLGYGSNVQYLWESGRAFPLASRFFQVAAKAGHDVDVAVARFYARKPAWLVTTSLGSSAGVSALLSDFKGRRSVLQLSRITGQSRFAMARWFKGEAEPRLPDFLRLLDALTLRLLDFLHGFVDPAALASASSAWLRLQAARQTAYDAPWSHAVLRAIELEAYQAQKVHVPGWIARRVGISLEQEARGLQLLESAGQIRTIAAVPNRGPRNHGLARTVSSARCSGHQRVNSSDQVVAGKWLDQEIVVHF